ncbi:hypothetical protein MTO96_005441 [Rhipicephalus appendiculatus]
MGRSAASRGSGRHMRRRFAGLRWRSGTRRRGGRRGGRLAHSMSVTSDIGYSTADNNSEARRSANAARSGAFAQHLANALRRNPTPPRFPPPRPQRLDAAAENDAVRAMTSEHLATYSTSLPPTGAPKMLPTTMQQPLPSQSPPLQTPSQQQSLPPQQPQPLSASQEQQSVPPQQPPLEPQPSQEVQPAARPTLLAQLPPSAPPQRPPQPLLQPFSEVAPRPLVAAKFSKGADAAKGATVVLVGDSITAASDADRAQASGFDDTVVEDFVAANYDSGGGAELLDGRPGAQRDSIYWRRGKRRRSTPSRKRRARSRKNRRRYGDEESDSESDSESSSDDSDDNQPSPTRSRDRSRHKRRRQHRKACRCYRRSICECDEGLSRMSRPMEAFTRKDVPQLGETWEQTMTASFPDFFEEVTEEYLAPGHPDYNAAYGGTSRSEDTSRTALHRSRHLPIK